MEWLYISGKLLPYEIFFVGNFYCHKMFQIRLNESISEVFEIIPFQKMNDLYKVLLKVLLEIETWKLHLLTDTFMV